MLKQQLKSSKLNPTKAQSAMEYLMTYGWAILIIAVVLALLSAIGVFGGGGGGPNACIAAPGFSCTNPSYTSNGVSVTLVQDSGENYYNVWAFVVSSSEGTNPAGFPKNFSESNTNNMVPLGTLTTGQSSSFNFPYSKAGAIPNANIPIGTSFTGYVWIGYCTTSVCPTPTNFAKVATINAKESGSSGFASGTSSTTTACSTTTSTTTVPSISYVPITLSNNQPVTYVPITITNAEGSPTASGFQQMVGITTDYSSGGEDTNLQNVEFSTVPEDTGTVLQAWCESGCTSSADAVWWVNLAGEIIPADGSNTVYMNFMPTSVMSASVPSGDRPRRSITAAPIRIAILTARRAATHSMITVRMSLGYTAILRPVYAAGARAATAAA